MELKKLNLPYTVVNRNDDTVIEGYVIRTEPAAGTTMEEGDSVVLYVSSGASLSITTVPGVAGLTLDEAKKALQIKKISVGEIRYEDSEKPAGTVLSVTPEAGEKVPEKITSASLTVSNGARFVEPIEQPVPSDADETDTEHESPDEKAEENTDHRTDEENKEKQEPDEHPAPTPTPDREPASPDDGEGVPSPDSHIPAPSEV